MIRITPKTTSFRRGQMMCRSTYWSEEREKFPRFFALLFLAHAGCLKSFPVNAEVAPAR